MKNFKLINYLLIAASGLVFMQCTSDYQVIKGDPGDNGTNGIDGVDGVDGIDGVGVQVCIDCHSSTHRDVIKDAYALSGHANGSSWSRGSNGECARCHNNQGYIDYLSGQFYEIDETGDPNEYVLDDAGYPVTDANGDYIPNPDYNPNYGDYLEDANGNYIQTANWEGYAQTTPIYCTGCHNPEKGHRSFDFENDGNDYALRNIDPIKLFIDSSVTLDMTSTADPLGRSNTCINCHQPRNSYPVPSGSGTDMITITSQRYGPHHGPQSVILEGIMGANIAGSTGYPGRGTGTHKTGSSCTNCHMGVTTDGTDGSHTWEPTLNTCVQCHTSMTSIPDEIPGFEDFYTLHDLLVAKGYISASGSVQGGNGGNASSSNPLVVPVKDAQVIWNYKTIEEDKSNGIHNPNYVRALLKNSIEALQN